MKKLAFLIASLLAGLAGLRAQTIDGQASLNFYLGVLTDAQGAPIADGSLLQILAVYHGTTLAAPAATDFLGGSTGATVLWQGAFDSTFSGQLGATSLTLSAVDIYADGTLGNYLTAGATVFVRWFPELTAAAVVPGATSFGQYGYSTLSGSSLDTSWTLPAAGGSTDIFLLTTSVDGGVGTLANSLGQAGSAVSAVPEPATAAVFFGLAVLGFGWRFRGRRRTAS